MANKEDLRYVRTEKSLRSAFMELASKNPVDTITASALCRYAGISRNAFYLHYSSVSALYGALVDEILDDVRRECFASCARLLATRTVDEALAPAIVSVFDRHEKLLRVLLPADDGTLAKRLAEGLENAYVESALLISEQGDSFDHRMSCAFAAWAHVGILTRWIAETDLPISESIDLFAQLQAGLSESATRFLMA